MNLNLFGTDGIRRPIGTSPLTPEHLPIFGYALGHWAQQKYDTPTLLLACDTRGSHSFIKAALNSGLLLHPVTIYDASVLPTPALCALMQQKKIHFDCGIIISASHNPYYDNGIKIIDAISGKLNEADEYALSTLFEQYLHIPLHINADIFGTLYNIPNAHDIYIHHVLSYFKSPFLTGKTILLDCAHGATYQVAPQIFQALGAHTITLNDQPNGTNINHNCGALFPEYIRNAMLTHHADIGFAFDGDGDRVIVVTTHGDIKNGDDILALLMQHPHYTQEKGIVGTVMSNHGLAVMLAQHNKQLIRTNVGDKYVAERLEQEQMLLGGEQSGHIIMRNYLSMGDGIFTALRLIEVLINTNNWSMKTFTKYPQLLINVPITNKKNLDEPPIASIIAAHEAQLSDGRLIVRYSGTENILRIMVEDKDHTNAQQIIMHLSQELQKKLCYI